MGCRRSSRSAGLIIMCLGGENDLEGGARIIGAGLAIYFINWLFRIGVSGERDARPSSRRAITSITRTLAR